MRELNDLENKAYQGGNFRVKLPRGEEEEDCNHHQNAQITAGN